MRILVFGAGVLGSLYASRLFRSGYQVEILARGNRFEEIKDHGIILTNAVNLKEERFDVPVVDTFGAFDEYDLVLVLVRRDQISNVLPVLSANKKTNAFLFMVNNPLGYQPWIEAVGQEKLMLGFAGAGGIRDHGVVYYHIVSPILQPTTIGELNGEITPRIKAISQVFANSGFPVTISKNMDAWQKTHVAWVSAVANAIYAADGDGYKLSKRPEIIRMLVTAIQESFTVLKKLDIPVTPKKFNLIDKCPEMVLHKIIKRWCVTDHFDIIAIRHSQAAYDEMRMISEDFQKLARSIHLDTPAMDELHHRMKHYQSMKFIN